MRFGFVLPRGDARDAAELAEVAEQHGWDGFFVWEGVWGVDAWVMLAAAAMRTRTIRLGTLLTPVPRRRPWDLAGQIATVDNLSGGRVITSVGLGALHQGWTAFEPDQGRKVRAELLDESLDILRGLLGPGQPFRYEGRHYRVEPTDFMVPPPPVQRPHPPFWVVGSWPAPKSMRRAARADGWLPTVSAGQEVTPATIAEGVAWIRELRAAEGLPPDGYDVIHGGVTPGDDPAAARASVEPWAAAGATWWIEGDWSVQSGVREYAEARLAAGPPPIG